MDLDYGPDTEEFRAEVRDWLAANLPTEPLPPMDTTEGAAAHREWERRLADARLSVAGGPWSAVTAWAGPWPVDERWWDDAAHRRRVRWQVLTANGAAYLLSQQGGRWEVEATYD